MINFFDRLAVRLRLTMTQPINTSAVIIMAIYTFMWGCFVANPFWSVFNQAPLYSVLMNIAPEWVWGVFAMICGGFMIYGVVKHSYDSLTSGAFVGAIHWLVIAACYVAGDWQNTGGLTSLMIAAYCAFVWLNLKMNKHHFPFSKAGNLPVD